LPKHALNSCHSDLCVKFPGN